MWSFGGGTALWSFGGGDALRELHVEDCCFMEGVQPASSRGAPVIKYLLGKERVHIYILPIRGFGHGRQFSTFEG